MLGLTSFRRSTSSRVLRVVFLILAALSLTDLYSLSSTLPSRHSDFKSIPDMRSQRVFIVSIHWNNARILQDNWNKAVLDLVEYFGVHNVYISIYESGSWDETKNALRMLESDLDELDVKRTITLEESTHLDEIQKTPTTGWIETPRGKKELRRIPYLSKLRNWSLQPLNELATKGIKFDKVLFLNDVVFDNSDIAKLLATRDGEYAAACSLDFRKPPHYYDTFALRDSEGHEAVSSTYPYFRSKASRDAMMSNQPVPVQSCWNGIVAFDARSFYGPDPLKFRGISDDLALQHVEASECCLIHADNPLTRTQGVWLNPDVRVGYNLEAYAAVHSGSSWPGTVQRISGIWANRIRRWFTTATLKGFTINSRLRRWAKDNPDIAEPGTYCLINEMQVLVGNGWAHV